MKKFIICFLAIALLSAFNVLGTVLSSTNKEIYIAVEGEFNTNQIIRFDDKIVWVPFSNVGTVSLNYGKPEYSIKLNLIGPDGKVVAKSDKGKAFGSKFDQVRRYEDLAKGWHMGSIDAQGNYDARAGALSGRLLPAAKDLFDMDKPGIYTLEFQIQMYRINKATNGWSRDPIRFPPVMLKIEKPAK